MIEPSDPAIVIGGLLSPYVRKVLAVCEIKRVPYQIDPIVPFFGNDAFSKLSPLRRIPVYIDDKVTLADSSVICQYLEDRYPDPPLYPRDIAARAQARWLEEFADTRMGDVFIWRIFNEAVIKPGIWQQPRNVEAIARSVREDLPEVLDYLESVAPPQGFAFGAVSIGDISVAVFFRNLHWSRVDPDTRRWPRTTAWIERICGMPPLDRLTSIADRFLRTPIHQQRAALNDLGLRLTEETLATVEPRRGPMTV